MSSEGDLELTLNSSQHESAAQMLPPHWALSSCCFTHWTSFPFYVFQKFCTAPMAVMLNLRHWMKPSGGAPRRTCWEPLRVTLISLLHFMTSWQVVITHSVSLKVRILWIVLHSFLWWLRNEAFCHCLPSHNLWPGTSAAFSLLPLSGLLPQKQSVLFSGFIKKKMC